MLEVRFRTLMGWKTTELNKECSEFPLRNQLWFKTILCSIWSASHIEASFPCTAKSFTIEHDRVVGPSHPRCSESGCLTIWVWTKSGGMLALLPCGKLQREMSCAALCFCGGLSASAAATAKLLQLCPTLCDPIDGSPPGSPVPGILQARTLEWVAISFSNAWKWKVKVKSLSCVRLFLTPWTAAHQAPPSMGFPRQATREAQKRKKKLKNCPCNEIQMLFFSHPIVSDSVRPHRQQPTRLPDPWDSPGKNTGVGCHFLLQCMKVKSESEVA